MGSLNILCATVKCSSCKSIYPTKIQFKFGNTWHFHYNLGDKVSWGGNDIGIENLSNVKVYGILEDTICPVCGRVNEDDEFDIFFEEDVIKRVQILSEPRDYINGEGDFSIIT